MATKKRPQDKVPSLAAVERDAAQFLEPELREHGLLNERVFNAIGEAANLAAELPLSQVSSPIITDQPKISSVRSEENSPRVGAVDAFRKFKHSRNGCRVLAR